MKLGVCDAVLHARLLSQTLDVIASLCLHPANINASYCVRPDFRRSGAAPSSTA
jgi:hypothetical protein